MAVLRLEVVTAMRVLVCGGRDFLNRTAVWKTLNETASKFGMLTIIQGGAKGADAMAREWCADQMRQAPRFASGCLTYHAEWLKHGPKAGPIRNQRMLDEGKPDLVVAFPGGRGTADMVRRAKAAGVPVREIEPPTARALTISGKGNEGWQTHTSSGLASS